MVFARPGLVIVLTPSWLVWFDRKFPYVHIRRGHVGGSEL